MEIILLHNPGAGDAEPSRKRLLKLLRGAGYRPRYFNVHSAFKKPEKLRGSEFIVVAGGDGSFRKTVLRLRLEGRPLALLPLGTANNIASTLGIEGTPAEIIASWAGARRQRFDVGIVQGPWGEKRFVEGVGLGLFGRAFGILKSWNGARPLAAREDRVLCDLRAVTMLAHELAPVAAEAKVDGKTLPGPFLLLEILNIVRVGAGVELAPKADIADGRFDVIAVAKGKRPQLVRSLVDNVRGAAEPSRLPVLQSTRIKLVLPKCDFRIDDDIVPVKDGTKIEITMDPAGIEVLVPSPKRSGKTNHPFATNGASH